MSGRCEGSDGEEECACLSCCCGSEVCRVLSPSSVYEKDAPHVSAALWKYLEESHLPLLGICYGLQEIAYHYGGTVASCEHREYGHALVGIVDNLSGEGRVLI